MYSHGFKEVNIIQSYTSSAVLLLKRILSAYEKKCRKDHICVCFCIFPFHGIILYFLMFPSNENVRKQHLSTNAYFCVNVKFPYVIGGRKDEIFCVALQRKQAIFS